MQITAADVKRLREDTDAPMMDCKQALEEAEGNYERAKEILREKGKAAAAKKADRTTKEGIATFHVSMDGKKAAGVVVECETDFVSATDKFKQFAFTLAEGFLHAGKAGADVVVAGKPASEHVIDAVNEFRENIQIRYAEFFTTEHTFALYNHHNGKLASLVELSGTASNLKDVGYHLGVQAVAMGATFTNKDEVPQSVLDKEIELETKRAIDEGKKPEIAENIAKGRVNKEYIQQQVLMEQVYYGDNKKVVSAFVNEEAKAGGGDIKVLRFIKLAVGQSAEGE